MEISLHDNLLGLEISDSSPKSSPTSGFCSIETSPDETFLSERVLKSFVDRFCADSPRSSSTPKTNLHSKANDAFAILSDNAIDEIQEAMFNVPLAPVEATFINGFGNNALSAKSFTETTSSERSSVGSKTIVTSSYDVRRFGWDLWINNAIHQCITSPPLPARVIGPPSLDIFCSKPCNLVKHLVTIVIRVHNLPLVMAMTLEMVEAMVTSPTGKRQPCLVQRVDNLMSRSFNASFKAGDETGFYEVQVKVVNPMKTWSVGNAESQDDRILTGRFIKIPVSRIYGEDSMTAKVIISCKSKAAELLSPSYNSDVDYRKFMSCKLWGLTANPCTNNLFYTDRCSNEVTCVDPWGRNLFRFSQCYRNSTENLHCPTGITYDSTHGRLLIVDKGNNRVCFFSVDGQFISSFGSFGRDDGMFRYPWDVAVSPDGQHIVVSDPKNRRIQVFDRYGNFLRKFSLFDKNLGHIQYKYQFDHPRGVTFDGTGNFIYVTDFVVNNVIQIPLDLSPLHYVVPARQLCRPQGITVDDVGNLLIADSKNNCIRQVSPKGDLLSNVTNVLDHPIQFPMNVTTLAGGYVAVLDGSGKISIC
ncbi:unnamed protein product [Orchesella dallaii]|uniref:SMP-30/Gluconolactonase/LRE-like region domain-containing protein n=1 Tax=Orchesella dallaii TaxID=48710 RepID=A0ABP1QLW3_9HEXA